MFGLIVLLVVLPLAVAYEQEETPSGDIYHYPGAAASGSPTPPTSPQAPSGAGGLLDPARSDELAHMAVLSRDDLPRGRVVPDEDGRLH